MGWTFELYISFKRINLIIDHVNSPAPWDLLNTVECRRQTSSGSVLTPVTSAFLVIPFYTFTVKLLYWSEYQMEGDQCLSLVFSPAERHAYTQQESPRSICTDV